MNSVCKLLSFSFRSSILKCILLYTILVYFCWNKYISTNIISDLILGVKQYCPFAVPQTIDNNTEEVCVRKFPPIANNQANLLESPLSLSCVASVPMTINKFKMSAQCSVACFWILFHSASFHSPLVLVFSYFPRREKESFLGESKLCVDKSDTQVIEYQNKIKII